MSLLTAPRVAWPTVALFAAVCLATPLAIALALTGRIGAPLAVAITSIAAYTAFTPLHEAAHRSIARARWVNEVIGRIAGVFLLAPFPAARWFHLAHHRHTNDPSLDPDFWSGRGPWFLLPFRWATQDLHCYFLFWRNPRCVSYGERHEILRTHLAGIAIALALTALGYGEAVLLYWILPARIAITALAFAFDWLPHRPHVEQDRHLATRVVDSATLNVVLLGQSHHLVHHLYPGVPFYRYRTLWMQQRLSLLAKGVREFRLAF